MPVALMRENQAEGKMMDRKAEAAAPTTFGPAELGALAHLGPLPGEKMPLRSVQ